MTTETTQKADRLQAAVEAGNQGPNAMLTFAMKEGAAALERLEQAFTNSVDDANSQGDDDAADNLSSALNDVQLALTVLNLSKDIHAMQRGAIGSLCGLVKALQSVLQNEGITIDTVDAYIGSRDAEPQPINIDDLVAKAEELVGANTSGEAART